MENTRACDRSSVKFTSDQSDKQGLYTVNTYWTKLIFCKKNLEEILPKVNSIYFWE